MSRNLNVGLIGLGRLGSLYAKFLSRRVAGVKLAAISDTDPARLKEIAAEFDVSHSFLNPNDLLADSNVDAVVITTPTHTHREIVIAALDHKKPTFCEKPPALSLAECNQMKQAVARTGGFLEIGFMRRFDRAYFESKKRLDKGVIGRALLFKSSSRDPFPQPPEYAMPSHSGGMLLDMGIHDFDLARWFMGEVRSVFSVAESIISPQLAAVNDWDNAVVTLQFSNGSLGMVDLTRTGLYGYDISTELLGSDGTLRMGYLRETAILHMTQNSVAHDTVPWFMERFEQAYVTQLEDFAQKVLAGQPPSITIDDGISALRIALAATRSAHEKRPVEVNEIALSQGA
ncbi:MAG TPA: Gfo/Idh/MocA family oxidoreductase [Candidatus Acidoferrales bacterium]|nr:Gfo/Idh/MocA family oxidoreductase [Candidatus Acidoferrales bacterium]